MEQTKELLQVERWYKEWSKYLHFLGKIYYRASDRIRGKLVYLYSIANPKFPTKLKPTHWVDFSCYIGKLSREHSAALIPFRCQQKYFLWLWRNVVVLMAWMIIIVAFLYSTNSSPFRDFAILLKTYVWWVLCVWCCLRKYSIC